MWIDTSDTQYIKRTCITLQAIICTDVPFGQNKSGQHKKERHSPISVADDICNDQRSVVKQGTPVVVQHDHQGSKKTQGGKGFGPQLSHAPGTCRLI
jgi:hypothetical protein